MQLNSKADKIVEAALRDPFQEILYQSHTISIEMYIKMLLEYQKHLAKLEDQIDALEHEIEECKIIQSIRGIGEKIAAIFSEIGEIDLFDNPKN